MSLDGKLGKYKDNPKVLVYKEASPSACDCVKHEQVKLPSLEQLGLS